MANDSDNASLWAFADVYIADALGTANPANSSTAFSGSWTAVGILDGDEGFSESRDEDTSDYYGWGTGIVRTSRKNFKLTKSFTVLEDNETTRALIWPGSAPGEISVPVVGRTKIAFETREASGKVRRLITRNYAEISVDGDVTDNEADLKKVTLVATIFPDGDGVLFDEQNTPKVVSLALSPLTLALSLAGKIIGTVAATATYDDSSTGVVTAQAKWTTSNAAKATVASGYVTAVATGTANVSATYGGVTATAPCVVTVSS